MPVDDIGGTFAVKGDCEDFANGKPVVRMKGQGGRSKAFRVGGLCVVLATLVLIVGVLSLASVELSDIAPPCGNLGGTESARPFPELKCKINGLKIDWLSRKSSTDLPTVADLKGGSVRGQELDVKVENVEDKALASRRQQHMPAEATGDRVESRQRGKISPDVEGFQSDNPIEFSNAVSDGAEKTSIENSIKKPEGSDDYAPGVMSDVEEKQISSGSKERPRQIPAGSGGCNFTLGHWEFDPAGPLFRSNQCRAISSPQNCKRNGRPDSRYESYRWKPQGCSIPRFDAVAFLEMMRGRTMGFVGDSLARNQMESLMCLLLQASEAEPNIPSHRYFFPAYQFTMIRVWSSWLVRSTGDFPEALAPVNAVKLDLMDLDENVANSLPEFDVTIVSCGHWWLRNTAYFVGGAMVGGAGWTWNKSIHGERKIDSTEAFGVAIDTSLKLLGSIKRYSGLTILRTFTPDHYGGGSWDGGGSCSRDTPSAESPEHIFNEMMHQKQIQVFNANIRESDVMPNGSRLRLLDVFPILNFRGDGHPGSYRFQDPEKRMARDERGRLPAQDCLHWCLPGPMESMNELLFEILKVDV